MINKIIIDGENVELTESSKIPYTHVFQQAKTHVVKFGLDNTNEICAYAFKDCADLTKIEIPDTIEMLKRGAFKNCSKLPEITIGPNINYIGKECFDGCDNLKEIKFERKIKDDGTIDIPEVYCTIPAQTTCFVPNDTKYARVNFEDIDTSGDIDYFTRTTWNQYEHVDDLSELDENTYYYRNQWDSIGDNLKVKEYKNRYPVEGISFSYVSASAKVGDEYKLTYTILPENCTNLNLTWVEGSNSLKVNSDTGVNGMVYVNMLSENTGGNATVKCYAESGINATITFYIQPNTSSTETPENNG